MKNIYKSLSYLFFTLILGQASQTFAMNPKVFEPTGKEIGSDGWRFTRNDSKIPDDQVQLLHALQADNKNTLQDAIGKCSSSFNQPWMLWKPNRGKSFFCYPIEYFMFHQTWNPTIFDTFLELSPESVNGFHDYNPLKDILERMTNQTSIYDPNFTKYAISLIKHGINLDEPFPMHNGFQQDQSFCQKSTARESIQRLGSSGKIKPEAQEAFKAIEKAVNALPSTQRPAGPQAIQPQIAPQAASTPQIAQQPASSSASTAQIVSPSTPVQTNKEIFTPTRKEKYSDGWRKTGLGVDYTTPFYQVDFVWALYNQNTDKIQHMIQGTFTPPGETVPLDPVPLNEPCLVDDIDRLGYYYYPVEYVIHSSYPGESLETLLDMGSPINGFQPYNPLKDVLLRLSKPSNDNDAQKLLLGYLNILVKHKANLDAPLPPHNAFGPDTSVCNNCTARTFLDKIKSSWNPMLWKQVKDIFDTVPQQSSLISPSPAITASNSTTTPIATITTTEAPLLPNSTLQQSSAPAPTSQIDQQQIITPAPQPMTVPDVLTGAPTDLTAEDQIRFNEQYAALRIAQCAQNAQATSPFTKKTIFAAVLSTAVVAVCAKLSYHYWFAKELVDMRADLKITVKNETGTDMNLIVRAIDGTTIQVSLNNNGVWDGIMEPLAQLFAAGALPEDSVNAPVTINLKRYKKQRQSEYADLHITLYTTGSLQQLWHESPYNYCVTWQSIA
jgi:hypothetical protein